MDQGQSGAIQRMEEGPPLHLGVVAIEKEAFGSSSTTVPSFTFTMLVNQNQKQKFKSSLSLIICNICYVIFGPDFLSMTTACGIMIIVKGSGLGY